LDASRLGRAESGRAFQLVLLVLDCQAACINSKTWRREQSPIESSGYY
jgi:hypothetical protein